MDIKVEVEEQDEYGSFETMLLQHQEMLTRDEVWEESSAHSCEFCQEAFPTKLKLSAHLLTHVRKREMPVHGDLHTRGDLDVPDATSMEEKPEICWTCSEPFPSKETLALHSKTHERAKEERTCTSAEANAPEVEKEEVVKVCRVTLQRLIYCFDCEKVFPSAKELQNHNLINHSKGSPENMKSIHCHDEETEKSFLHFQEKVPEKQQRHSPKQNLSNYTIQKNIESRTCRLCGKVLANRKNMESHILLHSAERPFACKACPKAFVCKEYLEKHTKEVHSEDRPFGCDVCKKRFKVKRTLIFHKKIHTKEKRYRCIQCPKSFGRSGDLQRHMLVHTKERLYSCPVCQKGFGLKRDMEKHELIHEGKPHYCHLCFGCFLTEEQLEEHMMYCHKEPERQQQLTKGTVQSNFDDRTCPLCGKVLVNKKSLKRHMKMHSGEKPFQCESCPKAYVSQVLLRRHVKAAHAPREPGFCKSCNKTFANKDSLRVHNKTVHSESRPFACDFCEKEFKAKQTLLGHMMIHTKEKPVNSVLKLFI